MAKGPNSPGRFTSQHGRRRSPVSADPDAVQFGGDGRAGDLSRRLDLNGDGVIDVTDQGALGLQYGQALPEADPGVTYPRFMSFRNPDLTTPAAFIALCPFGHQGLLHDEELAPGGSAPGAGGGLVHNRARTLHPGIGRFMQRDPRGYIDGQSLYQYQRSQAINHLDPFGTMSFAINAIPPNQVPKAASSIDSTNGTFSGSWVVGPGGFDDARGRWLLNIVYRNVGDRMIIGARGRMWTSEVIRLSAVAVIDGEELGWLSNSPVNDTDSGEMLLACDCEGDGDVMVIRDTFGGSGGPTMSAGDVVATVGDGNTTFRDARNEIYGDVWSQVTIKLTKSPVSWSLSGGVSVVVGASGGVSWPAGLNRGNQSVELKYSYAFKCTPN